MENLAEGATQEVERIDISVGRSKTVIMALVERSYNVHKEIHNEMKPFMKSSGNF